MARFLKSRKKAKGAAPGTLIFMGNQKTETPKIRLFTFNEKTSTEKEYQSIEKVLNDIKPDQTNWLNIDGLHDTSIIRTIGTHFNISPLALENVLNTGQRAKLFDDTNSLTIITKAVYYDTAKNKISVEQISFLIRDHLLISFQEKPGDHFEPVRERIRNKLGHISKCSVDYLLYTLMDSLVDNYLINIEQLGAKIEALEQRLSAPDKELSDELFYYKTEIMYFRKSIRPLREVMTRLLRSDSKHIKKETQIYLLELNDLIEHSNDAIDTYFTMIGDQLNLYNTNISNRANDVMKVLTIFASIFIPLTFIAGIYGTNFDFVPELHFKYSYYIMWGVMIIVAGSMLYYYKKNKWF